MSVVSRPILSIKGNVASIIAVRRAAETSPNVRTVFFIDCAPPAPSRGACS
jgi:hypothetical protein